MHRGSAACRFAADLMEGIATVGGRDLTPSSRPMGHQTPLPKTWSRPPMRAWRAYVDASREPVLFIGGHHNRNWRASAAVMFPDRRWLRLLIRGTWERMES